MCSGHKNRVGKTADFGHKQGKGFTAILLILILIIEKKNFGSLETSPFTGAVAWCMLVWSAKSQRFLLSPKY